MSAFYTLLIPAIVFGAGPADDPDQQRLRSGEVILEEIRQEEPGGAVNLRILIQAPAQVVWNVISQCEQAHRYLLGMQDCEVLLDEPGQALTRHVIDTGFLAPKLDYTFRTKREPHRHMAIELVDGNLKQMNGYWDFQPFEGGVMLEHEVQITPVTPAPRWLVRRKLRKDLPDMLLCIRALAGGSLSVDSEVSDLAACNDPPGLPDQ